MKLCLPINQKDNNIFENFDEADRYVIYNVGNNQGIIITRKGEMDDFINYLYNEDVKEVICDKIDPYTHAFLNDFQIKVSLNNQGDVKEILRNYIKNMYDD